jgi:hypothetical protein
MTARTLRHGITAASLLLALTGGGAALAATHRPAPAHHVAVSADGTGTAGAAGGTVVSPANTIWDAPAPNPTNPTNPTPAPVPTTDPTASPDNTIWD